MKTAICELDMDSAKKIEYSIRRFYADDDIQCFASLFALVTFVYEEKKGDVDLIILPVDIGDEDGIEAARSLQEFYPGIQIIFLSDLTRRIQDVFQIKPCYLLLRPFEEGQLERAITLAHAQYHQDLQDTISFKFKGNLFRLRTSEIIYVESLGRKLYIYTCEQKWEVNMNMDTIRRMLPQNFVLCHRSYLVNPEHVLQVGGSDIELYNHMHVPLSRNRSAEIMEALGGK